MITSTSGGIVIDVRVIPRAGRSGIAGIRNNVLLVRLHASPVDGAANAELVDVIADALGVVRRAVTLISGQRARQKQVRVDGISVEDARLKLLPEA